MSDALWNAPTLAREDKDSYLGSHLHQGVINCGILKELALSQTVKVKSIIPNGGSTSRRRGFGGGDHTKGDVVQCER